MRRTALIASILALTLACDKQTRAPEDAEREAFTDLTDSSTVLFQVFGPREAPKLAPIAVVRGGSFEPLSLSETGWRMVDSSLFAMGRQYSMYRNGAAAGTLEIVRGMWPVDSEPLYSVPGCRRIVPHALGTLRPTVSIEETVELLASSRPLAQRVDTRPVPAGAEAQGRTLASAVASAAEIGPEDLNGLDYHARWLRTGVGPSGRTLLASYIDPNAGDLGPGAGSTAMVFVLAEDSAGTLVTSYSHAVVGEARTVEFQRLQNFADVDGDSIAELFVESWRYAALPSLVILKRDGARWVERFRVNLDWCVDGR